MKQLLLIVFVLLCNLCLAQTVNNDTDISYMSSGGKLRPLQAIMDIRHYTLALEVDPTAKSIDGYAEIELILSKQTDTLLFDLVHLLKVRKADVDKRGAMFSQLKDSLLITSPQGFKPGKHLIRIAYGGNPPVAVMPPWKGGFSWKTDKAGNPWVVINCQLEGASVYFPCKDHPSDEPNEGVDLFITVPAGLTVAGPGLLKDVQKKKDKSTFHWKTNYTISNYCIVFNVAKYAVVKDSYTTINNHVVPVEFYITEPDVAHAKEVIAIRKRDTRILEKYFGEYPWYQEKIGIAQVTNPGMEHQTMITYGDPFNYTRYGSEDYSANLFHEYAHEWWANKVTNKDWAHMWIQEGIATFAEGLWFLDVTGEKGYNNIVLAWRRSIRNEKPLVQGEGLNQATVYNGDIYSKGAFFMHTLRHVLGDSVFFPTLKKFIVGVKYPYDFFWTTDDIEKFFSKESGRDLKPLFDFSLLTTKMIEFDMRHGGDDTWTVRMRNSPMEMPLDILTDTGMIHTTTSQKEPLKITSKTLPDIDPGGYYFKKVTVQ